MSFSASSYPAIAFKAMRLVFFPFEKKIFFFFFVLNFIAQYSYLVRLVVIFLKLCVLFMLEIKLNKLNLFDQTLLHVYITER